MVRWWRSSWGALADPLIFHASGAPDRRRMVKQKKLEKRYVWGTSIIQDDSPTSGLPPVGVNTDLNSSESQRLGLVALTR